jgi:hypothetical protein
MCDNSMSNLLSSVCQPSRCRIWRLIVSPSAFADGATEQHGLELASHFQPAIYIEVTVVFDGVVAARNFGIMDRLGHWSLRIRWLGKDGRV